MNDPLDVVVLVGSLRRESFTRRLAIALTALAPPGMKLELVPIATLPLYNPDEEKQPPQPWQDFRARVRRADGVLFATPEYNRSVPAPLKNAIDVGSRPYGRSVWDARPAAVLSCSPGVLGGFGANHHLRQSLVFLNMPALQQPEAYVGGVDKLLSAENTIANADSQKFFSGFLTAFERWIHQQAPR